MKGLQDRGDDSFILHSKSKKSTTIRKVKKILEAQKKGFGGLTWIRIG